MVCLRGFKRKLVLATCNPVAEVETDLVLAASLARLRSLQLCSILYALPRRLPERLNYHCVLNASLLQNHN